MRCTRPTWGSLILLLLVGVTSIATTHAAEGQPAEVPRTVMTQPGELRFADDFNRTEVGPRWKLSVRSYEIRDGIFVTGQRPDAGHPAVSRVSVLLKDAVIDFRFRFDGGKQITLVLNDSDYQGSHAGHICRAAVTPTELRLGDDREGTMKFGIYEKWKDPAKRGEVEELVKDRTVRVPIKLDVSQWHRLTVEIVGEEMVASLDGEPQAYLKSPGIAHATKNYWGLTTSGRFVEIDDLRAWSATLDPQWVKRRGEQFPASTSSRADR